MRAAERGDAALGLHLAEAAVVGGDDDVAGQRHLDPDREDDALHGGDDRLAALRLPRPNGSTLPSGRGMRLGGRAEELRHVEAGREVVARRAEHADPELVLPVEQR